MTQTLPTNMIRKPAHNKTMGIEIECILDAEHGYRHANLVRNRHHGFFYAGHDGSISTSFRRDEFGVEFVSQPLPFEWLCKEVSRLGKRFQWVTNDSCGIHVHVSRQWVSMNRLNKLMDRIYLFDYDQTRELFGRMFNQYNRPPHRYERDSRYCAINLTNPHTVEFRMFRSGDAAWAKECLRRTKLMVEFKGNPTFDNLLELFTNPEVK